MIKLFDLLKEQNNILIPRRSAEDRQKNYLIATQKKIQQYMKDGSKGNLNLSYTPITSLPDGLSVGNDLDLDSSKITSLPDGLSVGGYLILDDTPITTLPNNLTVGDTLYIIGVKLTSLPDNLSVGGNLDLQKSGFTSLPNNLSVGRNLWLRGLKITSLPNKLSVGDLDLRDTEITSFPPSSDLSVNHNIDLRNTPMSKKYTKSQLKQMLPGVKGDIII